jgi:hypothetical protein
MTLEPTQRAQDRINVHSQTKIGVDVPRRHRAVGSDDERRG